ncbi:MAG: hypothetical protein LBF16_10055 [Pseudomonadales bacterium]|nr:hypothetical protein [Pseudomonadales bacterium]
MRLRVLLVGMILLHPSFTFAAWHEASSEHLLIYADASERDLRMFAEKMERYHQAMTVLFPSHRGTQSPSNRLTVYAVGNANQVRKLRGGDTSAGLVGFYVPRAGGSAAFMPFIQNKATGEVSGSERVLMTEYAHHVRSENLNIRTPTWYNTGFAEYFASAAFSSNGDVVLGAANNYRAADLSQPIRQVSIDELLDSETHASRESNGRYDNFSVRSWSLFHYLYSSQDHRLKMVDYLERLNRGESEIDSARTAFGDLAVLNRELERYLTRPIQARLISSEQLNVAPIAIRELNPAEAAVLTVRMQFASGIKSNETEKVAEVAREARNLAAKYPDEPEVQAVLAEAEYTAGNDDAAIAAADQALAFNPNHMTALIQKGYALTRIATKTKAPAAWAMARSHFVAINKIEPDNPIPLLYYYRSFIDQGEIPTSIAIDGLEWALQLAPYDSTLRLMTAQGQIDQKRYQEAIQTLSVLAFNPRDSDKGTAMALLETAKKQFAEEAGTVAHNGE